MSSNTSTGQWLGYVVGAVVGYFTGGASYVAMGAALGGAVGGAIDPPKGPKLTGPRLSDLSQQGASYGVPIPRVYGSVALSGNIFWIENNALKETSHTEGGGKGGGGPETTTYKYSATFALGLCEGPIIGVRRIWVGGNLIYDAGSSDIGTLLASNASGSGFRVYTGSETQMPDPRMQATVGVANTPAYRGLAYILFEDFDLTDYGNTLLGAQIKVEVLASGTSGSVSLINQNTLTGTPRPYGSTSLYCSTDGILSIYRNTAGLGSSGPCVVMRYAPADQVEMFRRTVTPANNLIHVNGWADTPISVFMDNDGTIRVMNEYGVPYFTTATTAATGSESAQASNYHGRQDKKYLCTEFSAGATTVIRNLVDGTTPLITDATSLHGRVTDMFIGQNNFYTITSFPKVVCYDHTWVELWSVSLVGQGITITDAVGGADPIIRERSPAIVVLAWDNKFWSVSQSGFTYLGQATGFAPGYERHGGDHLIWPLWIHYSANENKVSTIRLDSLSNAVVPLANIVRDECLRAGVLSLSDLNTTSLTDSVRGYRVSETGALRAAIDPLQGAWPFDVIQSGYKVKFVRRGVSSSLATVPATDLDARRGGDKPGIRLSVSREMDMQLPSKVAVTHLDYSREYDIGEQYAERLNLPSSNAKKIEMPIVLTAGEAARLSEILLYMYWLERQDVQFSLPPSYRWLEPSDVITVDDGVKARDLRLTQISYSAEGPLAVTAKPSETGPYTSFAIGETGTLPSGTISSRGPTAFALLDIPLLSDSFDVPGYPVALSGYLPGWAGGTLYRSDDGGQTWLPSNGFARSSVMGVALSSLSSPADHRLIDFAGALNVRLFSGTLSSISEAQMLNGYNHFAYGADGRWEIIAARTAALQGDGSYILTDLLRGRFGTEWASGLHATYDTIVHMDPATLQFASASLNQIGQPKTYRAISNGATLDSEQNTAFTYTGVNLECLSPVWLNGNRHPTTSDWSLSWVRRTRTGGEWRDAVDATLGEASEAYEVEIYSSAAYTTLKRTLTGLSSPAATYTSAQQVTDFGSNQATLYVKVYQLSVNVGRGYPLTTSITR